MNNNDTQALKNFQQLFSKYAPRVSTTNSSINITVDTDTYTLPRVNRVNSSTTKLG